MLKSNVATEADLIASMVPYASAGSVEYNIIREKKNSEGGREKRQSFKATPSESLGFRLTGYVQK